jgi:DNA-binding transcriptional regulator YiaG
MALTPATLKAVATIQAAQKHRPNFPWVATPKPGSLDVRAIRLAARGTQQTFADQIGVPVRTLRNWEQGRREPTGPARVLLTIVAPDPWIVFDAANNQLDTPAAY